VPVWVPLVARDVEEITGTKTGDADGNWMMWLLV